MRIPHGVLEERVRAPLERRGVAPEDAAVTARVLLEAEARGYPAQGVRRVAEICGFLDAGALSPLKSYRIEEPAPAVRRFQVDASLGHPLAVEAVDAAAGLARSYGLGCAAMLGAGHIGYLTHYAERAAAGGVFAIVTTTSSPAVALPGSGKRLLGTNPLAFAFSYGEGIFCADFATGEVSRGEVLERKAAGVPFEREVGVDASGAPTADPAKILEGGILAFGGRKGMLVNLLLGTLAGPLAGGVPNPEVLGTRWPDAKPNKTDFFLCLDPAAFGDPADFEEKMRRFLEELAGAGTFHIPGQHSRALWTEALEQGFAETEDIRQLPV